MNNGLTDVAEAQNVSVADGLRQVADFLDANPDLEPATGAMLQMRCASKDDLRTLARALKTAVGRAEKSDLGNYFQTYARVGGVKVWGAVDRGLVCRKVVTGIRRVPQEIVEAHDEEIVEWVCDDAILGG